MFESCTLGDLELTRRFQNDGGSIPTRRELVLTTSKGPTTSDLFQAKQLNTEYLWTRCSLSDAPLETPIVSDYLGRLYNKQAVLEHLISRKTVIQEDSTSFKDPIPHIKSLKDIVEVHFSTEENSSTWICPITQKEILPEIKGSRFLYVVPCGHVFSEKGLKELDFEQCYVCDTPVDKLIGRVVINPADKTEADERLNLLREKGLSHNMTPTKTKKRKKEKGVNSSTDKKVKKQKV